MTPPTSAATPAPENLHEWMRRRAARAPERPAFSFKDQTWSYGQMQSRIEALSSVFAQHGVRPGDRVAWLGLNQPLIVAALFACARLGAIFVPLNFRLSAAEIAAILEDAGACLLVADAPHAPLVESVRAKLPCEQYLLCGDSRENWISLDSALDTASPAPAAVAADADDTVMLIYTSGTTGKPKGVMLSHRNIWVNNLNWILASDFTSADVTLNCAPLFHVGGLCVVLLPTLMVGGHNVLQEHFDPAAWLRDLARYRCTVSFAVPAMMLFASQQPAFAETDLSAMRLIVAGGAPVPEPLLQTYNARGIPVSQCYGMTEATSGVTFLETERATAKLGSCGRAGMMNEVCLVDREGRRIDEPGVRGEICMRGGNVTRGYWNRPAETAAAIDADGWMHSGDGAWFDDEGFYYICDRIKDMIISGGENIYPAEIESLIYERPEVAEAAVIGRRDERWGERVLAIVVLKPGASLDHAQLIAHLEPKLARYKLPRELHLLDAMPRNPNGKVLKTELRARFATPP